MMEKGPAASTASWIVGNGQPLEHTVAAWAGAANAPAASAPAAARRRRRLRMDGHHLTQHAVLAARDHEHVPARLERALRAQADRDDLLALARALDMDGRRRGALAVAVQRRARAGAGQQ